MMDSKQLSLMYLMEKSNEMAAECMKSVHVQDKTKVNNAISERMGSLFSALREVAEELKLNEEQVEGFVYNEHLRRQKER